MTRPLCSLPTVPPSRGLLVLVVWSAAAACDDTHQYLPDAYTAPVDDAGFKLDTLVDVLPADGATTATVTVRVPATTRADRREVTVSATAGTFVGAPNAREAKLTVDASGAAGVVLQAPQTPVLAIVRATVAGIIRTDSVRFARAGPTSVVVEPSVLAVRANTVEEVSITARLRRPTGRPSPGFVPTVEVIDANGAAAGFLGPVAESDTAGVVRVRFLPLGSATRWPVTITVKVDTAASPSQTPRPPLVEGRAVVGLLP